MTSYLSRKNSTYEALDNGETWTGRWELRREDDMLITGKTDQAMAVYLDFSPDKENVDSTITLSAVAGTPLVRRYAKGYRWYRMRLENNSGSNQTYCRFQTHYGAFSALTTPENVAIGIDHDTQVVRISEARLDFARSRYTGIVLERKFGSNPSIADSEEVVWQAGGLYTGFLTSAATVRIKAGGSADDDSAGTGAQTVVVEGLDENFAEASETITTNGTSASTATTTTFTRVFRAYVVNVGTYHGANAANIDIETSGGTLLARIGAGLGQTQIATYCVPAGKTMYIQDLHLFVDGTKTAAIRLNIAEASDTSTPFAGKRVYADYEGVSGAIDITYESLIQISEKTDVWISAVGPSAGAACSAEFGYFLVDN